MNLPFFQMIATPSPYFPIYQNEASESRQEQRKQRPMGKKVTCQFYREQNEDGDSPVINGICLSLVDQPNWAIAFLSGVQCHPITCAHAAAGVVDINPWELDARCQGMGDVWPPKFWIRISSTLWSHFFIIVSPKKTNTYTHIKLAQLWW